MIRWGAFFLVIGIGSFILPMMDMQFRIMQPLEKSQPAAGIAVAGVGVLLIVLGSIRANAKKARAIAQQHQFQAPPYIPSMPLPQQQQAAMWPGAMPAGQCMRCGQPLWAGDVVCRTCRLPVNFYTPPPQPPQQQQQFAYAAPPPPVAQRCPNPRCGQPIRPGKKFCAACGARLR